jgi:hypothetical protein
MKLLISLVLLLNIFVLNAQTSDYNRKGLLKELRGYIKADNYTKVDALIKSTISKHSEAKSDAELYNIWMNANYNLALAENRKIYLSTNPDTIKYMDYIYEVFADGLKCDSISRIPDSKGRVKRKFFKNINEKFSFFTTNLENAGKFFYAKRDYRRTCKFVEMCIMTKLWKSGTYTLECREDSIPESLLDVNYSRLAVLAVMSAYAIEDYETLLKMYPIAVRDSSRQALVLEFACKSYDQIGDRDSYLNLLNKCFLKYPDKEYFFASLIKCYNDKGDTINALNIAREAVKLNPINRNYWFVKGAEEQICQLEDSAIVSYSNAIKIKKDDAESYSCLADIYLKKAREEDRRLTQLFADTFSKNNYLEHQSRLKSLYAIACLNYESAREYSPEKGDLWLEGLKECYYKLNKGRELKLLEKNYK